MTVGFGNSMAVQNMGDSGCSSRLACIGCLAVLCSDEKGLEDEVELSRTSLTDSHFFSRS